jgi:hypothetical protein
VHSSAERFACSAGRAGRGGRCLRTGWMGWLVRGAGCRRGQRRGRSRRRLRFRMARGQQSAGDQDRQEPGSRRQPQRRNVLRPALPSKLGHRLACRPLHLRTFRLCWARSAGQLLCFRPAKPMPAQGEAMADARAIGRPAVGGRTSRGVRGQPLRRRRLTMPATSSAASMGLERCIWYPANSERWRSSGRAYAVIAIAGIWP